MIAILLVNELIVLAHHRKKMFRNPKFSLIVNICSLILNNSDFLISSIHYRRKIANSCFHRLSEIHMVPYLNEKNRFLGTNPA